MPPKSKKSTKQAIADKKRKRGDEEESSDEEATANDAKPSDADFNPNCDRLTSTGSSWNFKISSWNVNGIRAWLQKKGREYLLNEDPDVFCVMETKCSKEKLPRECTVEGYKNYWLPGDTDGYSGVGLYTKKVPQEVTYGIGIEKHDNEGRVITAEYDDFYVVLTYVPNAGRKLVRLDYRKSWDVDFRDYLKDLDSKKPVILCGDLNVAHQEIDLANPKNNKRNAGFTQEERDAFTELLDAGFVDSYRCLYPEEKKAYTFWTYMMNARAKDVGWRLDYFVLSEKLKANLCDSVIRKNVLGSDHCPITLFMAF